MYLSQLILNPRSRSVRADLADCRELHRTILRAFPDDSVNDNGARAHFGILYRVEVDQKSDVVRVLVQSRARPDWQRIEEGYLLTTNEALPNPQCKEIGSAYQKIRRGTNLAFRLRANPTKRVSQRSEKEQSGAHGKRVDLRTEQEWLNWIERKAASGGFDVATVSASPDVRDVRTSDEARVTGTRRNQGRSVATMTFGSVLFEGRLQVTDADQFRETLVAGIGPAKAYGFGLLSVAPPRE